MVFRRLKIIFRRKSHSKSNCSISQVPQYTYQLDDLPTEVLEMITQYIPLKDCARLERVCQRWRTIMRREWRRQKHFNLDDFITYVFRNRVDEVEGIELCVKELAIKIHPYAESISVSRLFSNWADVFLIKFGQLEHLKLETKDSVSAQDSGLFIPRQLKSLHWDYDSRWIDKLPSQFFRHTFNYLTTLVVRSFTMKNDHITIDALNFPNLQELKIEDSELFVENFHRLRHLKVLVLQTANLENPLNIPKILETATNKECELRENLLELEITYSDYLDQTQLLNRISYFTSLESLILFSLKSSRGEYLRSIGQGCVNLRSLCLLGIEDVEGFTEIAEGFQKMRSLLLCFNNQCNVGKITKFISQLSAERELTICCYNGPAEGAVQATGISNSHPNIKYQKMMTLSDFLSLPIFGGQNIENERYVRALSFASNHSFASAPIKLYKWVQFKPEDFFEVKEFLKEEEFSEAEEFSVP